MNGEEYHFYEPRHFSHSKTYKSWVKLFIKDLDNLVLKEGYEATNTRFWLNHPVRWIELVGIVVGITIKSTFCEIEVDDGSGKCIVLYIKGAPAESIQADFESNTCSLALTDLIRARGELVRDFKNDLQLVVKTLLKLRHDQELPAWLARLEERKFLQVPWHCEIKKTSSEETTTDFIREERQIRLVETDVRQHTKRNLRIQLLQYIREQRIREFTVAQLRSVPELDEAITLVSSRMWSDQVLNSTTKYRLLHACLADLVRDGSLLSIDAEKGKFALVGYWNLGLVIENVVAESIKQNPSRRLTVREVWEAVRESGTGMECVSKQMVEKLLKNDTS